MRGVKNCLVILLYINTSLIWEPLEPHFIWKRLLARIPVLWSCLQATWGKDFLCSAQPISVHINILKYRASDDWFLACFLLTEPSWCWEVSVWPLEKVWVGGNSSDSVITTGLWGLRGKESVDLEWSLAIAFRTGFLRALVENSTTNNLKASLLGSHKGGSSPCPFPAP